MSGDLSALPARRSSAEVTVHGTRAPSGVHSTMAHDTRAPSGAQLGEQLGPAQVLRPSDVPRHNDMVERRHATRAH